MKKIRIAIARLCFQECSRLLTPHLLRGAIASQFPDQPIFHQHTSDGFIYRYPMVQYRRDKTDGLVFAFGAGAESLIDIPFLNMSLRLGGECFYVSDVQLNLLTHTISVSSRLNRYFFRSPWLPFNQTNYSSYQSLSPRERQTERDRLAVANILSALKGLDIFVRERIYAGFIFKKSRICQYKKTSLLGFQGTLLTNIDLPSGFAIGKAVSHGYGWLEHADTTV